MVDVDLVEVVLAGVGHLVVGALNLVEGSGKSWSTVS